MPIGIEDLLRARGAHAFTLGQLAYISAIPVLLALVASIVLLRGKNASLFDLLKIWLLLIPFNLLVGTLGLVLGDAILKSLDLADPEGMKLYLASLVVIGSADLILCNAVRQRKSDAE